MANTSKRKLEPVNSNKTISLVSESKKKKIRTELGEEEFSERLGQIISRDYFPELSRLKVQKEYLDAKASNDLSKIRELQERYSIQRSERRTSPLRRASPENFDARSPSSYRSAVNFNEHTGLSRSYKGHAEKTSEVDNYTVDSFLNTFASCDDTSFEEIMEFEKERERIRNAWMYEAEDKHNKELVTRLPEPIKAADEQLMIAAAPDYIKDKPKDLDNWKYKARNSILFDIDEVPLTMEERFIRHKRNFKEINRSATRLPYEVQQKFSKPSAARSSVRMFKKSGKVDITGKDISKNESNDELLRSPSPSPGIDDSPFMTWGELEGTPFRLDASDIIPSNSASSSAFKIPEIPIRDRIAEKLRENTARNYSDKKKSANMQSEKLHSNNEKCGTPKSSSRLLALSPAARNLVTQKLRIHSNSDRRINASAFTLSGTPVSSIRSTKISSLPSPIIVRKGSEKPTEKDSLSNSSITDNLLNFGKSNDDRKCRPSAADFF